MDGFAKAMLISKVKFPNSNYNFVTIDLEKYPECKGKYGLPYTEDDTVALYQKSEIAPATILSEGIKGADPYEII